MVASVAPVSCCLIVRNEGPRILKCLESIRPYVAEICVLDTGSTDDTVQILRQSGLVDRLSEWYGCNEDGSITGAIENFAAARNRSFELASQPWILWLDGDDTVRGAEALAGICAQYEAPEAVCVMFPYEYSHDHHGNVTCRHYRERLLKPANRGEWKGPVHEVWCPGEGFLVVQREEMTWVHNRIGKEDTTPNRNLRILDKWLIKHDGPDVDARMLYYAALECGQVGQIDRSIKYHERYVERSGWEDERCLSMLDLSKHYQSKGDNKRAIEWALKSIAQKEHWAEPRFQLGRLYYSLAEQGGNDRIRNWEKCVHHFQQGLELPPSQTPLFINPLERIYDVHRYLNVALSNLGRIAEAKVSVLTGLQAASDDPNLRHNLKYYTGILARNDLDRALTDLRSVEQLSEDQHALILKVLEGKFRALKPGEEVAQSTPRPAPGGLDIVIFTGPAYERWNPETLVRDGMGGSETMAWQMAKRLAARGNRVRVFADCAGLEGTFEGVEWLDSQTSYLGPDGGPTCDVLISSRIAEIVDYPCTARVKIAWVHDVHMGDGLTNARALKFDRFLCLSEWHKGFFCAQYPWIHPDSVIVTRNGIDLTRYDHEVERSPARIIYSSSPDRGLQVALQAMPAIRAQVPDAELHVYYGFGNWEKSHDQNQRNLAQAIRGMIQAYAPFGVHYHDRVSQEQLAIEQLKSSVWGYPTWFCCHPDTCISVPGDHRGGPPTVRIADMVGKSGFPVYAFNEAQNRFELATVKRVWMTKVADELVGIRLDDGQLLRLTPDHLVLTFDGDWVEAGSLKPGDSLRALHYRYNVAIRDGNGRWTDEHRLVGKWKAGRELRSDEHVDHSDLQRLDNRPETLTVMTASEHFSKTHKGKRLSRKHVEKKTLAIKATYAAMSPERRTAWHAAGGATNAARIRALSEDDQRLMWAARNRKRIDTITARMADPVYAEARLKQLQENCQKGRDSRWGKNHKVVSVERIVGPIPVYDMEVEGLHNFVADGVVVHNCETSCITAMEAQAAGLRIVTSPIAALNETAGDRGVMIEGDWLSPEYQARYIAEVVRALQAPSSDGIRERNREYARSHFGLETLADDWCALLQRTIVEVERDLVPRYKPAA